jgi:signal transduction histidine kinase
MKVALQLLGVTLNQEFDLNQDLLKPKTEQTRIARYFQILQEECEREISLINDLLDLQRLDVGNHPIAPETIVLKDWLPGVVDSFSTRAKNRNQTLDLEMARPCPDIYTDLNSLERFWPSCSTMPANTPHQGKTFMSRWPYRKPPARCSLCLRTPEL